LVRVSGALRASIDRWREEGSGSPPSEVVLQALYQQRLYRLLPRHPSLARITIANLPARLRDEARNIVRASSLLTGLVRPISKPSAFRTGRPEPAGRLLGYYRQAERRFGIDWAVLAALNYVESKFGKVKSTSYAGAQGPMQFIPSTWAAYGMGGDIQDPHDAILGAANYLRHSGAPGDYRRALYAYNHAWPYVEAILLYARRMRADVRWFFTLYNWQVFVLTTKGDRRLTGPGLGPSG
jgi:soluble lytic murein transglycosylase-like protein